MLLLFLHGSGQVKTNCLYSNNRKASSLAWWVYVEVGSTFKAQAVFKSTMTFTFCLAFSDLCTCAQTPSHPGMCEELTSSYGLHVCAASLVSRDVWRIYQAPLGLSYPGFSWNVPIKFLANSPVCCCPKQD